jgi:hypothetical protein
MAESEAERLGKGSAAELLATWRAAERDHAAAIESAGVASLAVEAAQRAAKAAHETAEAARLSLDAAQRADHAARETAEAAQVLSATAAQEQSLADAAVSEAKTAETDAKDAFQQAQRQNFPKESG